MLHDGVVNGFHRRCREGVVVEPEEIQVISAQPHRFAAGRECRRAQPLQFLQKCRRGKQENAAIPEPASRGDVPLGLRPSRLLDELRNLIATSGILQFWPSANIAIARLRGVRGDPERYQGSTRRGIGCHRDGSAECLDILNHMVGWQQEHERVRVIRQKRQGRGRGSRGGVPGYRLQHDAPRRHADLPHLFSDDEPVLVAGDNKGPSEQAAIADPKSCLLQHASV